jgi:hypothetical protein
MRLIHVQSCKNAGLQRSPQLSRELRAICYNRESLRGRLTQRKTSQIQQTQLCLSQPNAEVCPLQIIDLSGRAAVSPAMLP